MNGTSGLPNFGTRPRAPLWLMVSYGQSNAENGGLSSLTAGTRVATSGTINATRALMLNTGLLGTGGTSLDPATITAFSSAVEDATNGETGGSSFMRALLAGLTACGDSYTSLLYRTSGYSGASITALSAGTTPYANFIAAVTKAATIATTNGRRLVVPFYSWRQGEADADSMSQSTYYSYLTALHAALVTDIRAATAQPEPVWMILLPLVAPDGASRNITATTLAQLQAVEAGLTIAPSCCPYWFNGTFGFNSGQSVHWTPLGKAHLVEFDARAARIIAEAMAQNPSARLGDTIYRRVYAGASWSLQAVPFETSPRTTSTSITRSGNVITGTVPYAEGGLAIYTSERGAATNSGFAWTPSSGNGTISSVEIVSAGPINAQWRVTLSAGAAGTLTYGTTEQSATADNAPDCWGDIFDTCAETSSAIPGRTLRQGMLPFSAPVN